MVRAVVKADAIPDAFKRSIISGAIYHFIFTYRQWLKCNRMRGKSGNQFPTSNFWSEAFPHLKILRDAGERKGGTQWYTINVHFKIQVAVSVK